MGRALTIALLPTSLALASPEEPIECPAAIPVFTGGQQTPPVCPEDVERQRLAILDLSDDFAPRALRPEPDLALSYGDVYRSLAAERDRYLELWGVFPTLTVLRDRLADQDRHLCHDRVDDGALAAERTLRPDARTGPAELDDPVRRDAIRALQEHLVCDRLLAPDAVDHRFGRRTREALEAFRRRHMIARSGGLGGETRELLLADSRELDFRALLRALRERVADATGIIEDGSAAGEWGQVLGRSIEPDSLRDAAGHAPLASGAPDRLSPATEAAAIALGWTDPAAALAALDRTLRGGVRQAALRLPLPPAYHGPAMELRAEIDRGDVRIDETDGREGERRPVLILYARDGANEIALVRWPTTIGGWQAEKLPDGTVTLLYKPSPPGRYLWRDIISAPSWFPPPSAPDEELVRGGAGGWTVREESIGPGILSAYGLVAIFHRNERGGDTGIRTHGTGDYLSVARGQGSHGCHRLFTFRALRLAGFLIAHRRFVARGETRERYERSVVWAGGEAVIRRDTRGFVRTLEPPVPIQVLEGTIHTPQ